ncbi:NB-ARC domain containing protein [Dorcoceras hygrometricum]|uniref:NB-ARC domain containing protein n=1 Tax=Dorcoceras hygrometricum TaxID=472368 RepID=A0A2Z7AF84_9LAMI|nr:NB-ARC domain containing protein [Dorcoceras hygrometricum]
MNTKPTAESLYCEPSAGQILRLFIILKKMMNSNRICPVVGSQYKDSAVGLVFMESAVELAMETSKVESAVRNQAKAKLNQLEHNKPVGTMTTSCKC